MIKSTVHIMIASMSLLVLLALPLTATEYYPTDSYHDDFRNFVRVQYEPKWDQPTEARGSEIAETYLSQFAADFGLASDLTGLELTRTQESLVGMHYTFEQNIDGIDVEHGQIIVSVAKIDNRIYQVYNNIYPVGQMPAQNSAIVAEEDAYDAAWNHLRAHGNLTVSPSTQLIWQCDNGDFRLIYRVNLEVEAPYGSWQVTVDATNGSILGAEDMRLYRVSDQFANATLEERNADFSGETWDRQAAFTHYAELQNEQGGALLSEGSRATGTATVFDPDPRTTLQSSALQNTSPASAFVGSYFTRDLLDIMISQGVYRLTGPWVNIVNWDSPHTQPSTTTDGIWDEERGPNSFNDGMTYFHLDQNQRYMQSLGFTGGTGIQEGSIGADTDGCGGADNSYYIPSTNRLAFGHGCVDDDEDADVILHEYGHAIQHDIVSSWNGGDTGAIGEGFGDYWAGSYSYSTPNGMTFHPEWIFSWDGHGDGNQCWGGRRLNATGAQYNPSQTYGAHVYISGGYVSDELWSAPIFMSLVDLVDLGETRESVDQIILESHFGIGYGARMPDMANATVAAAEALQPGGPHAYIFHQRFADQNILEENTSDVADVEFASFNSSSFPNPLYDNSTIRFQLPSGGANVELAIYDLTGRKVRSLHSGQLDAGTHDVAWDGTADDGASVSSGVYFYHLNAGRLAEKRQLVLMR